MVHLLVPSTMEHLRVHYALRPCAVAPFSHVVAIDIFLFYLGRSLSPSHVREQSVA